MRDGDDPRHTPVRRACPATQFYGLVADLQADSFKEKHDAKAIPERIDNVKNECGDNQDKIILIVT